MGSPELTCAIVDPDGELPRSLRTPLWAEHLGPELAGQLREGLLKLREITDPYA